MLAGVEVEGVELGHVAADLGFEVEGGFGLGLLGHLRAEIAEIDGGAVTVGGAEVLDGGVEVGGGEVEGDGPVVDQRDSVHELYLLGFEVEEGVLQGLGAGGGVFGDGLVGFAVFVDDEVDAGGFDAEEGEADVRGEAGAGGVLEEGDDFDADEDVVGGEVGGFAGAFEAVDDEVVGLDGEVPKVELDRAQLYFAAGGVFEDADDFLAYAVLEVGRGRVPGEAAEED